MRVLHLDSNHVILAQGLSKLGCTNVFDFKSSKEDIMVNIENHDAIVIRSRFPIDKAFLDAAPHLRFIGRVGSGLENIDVAYAKSLGIEIISSPVCRLETLGSISVSITTNDLAAAASDPSLAVQSPPPVDSLCGFRKMFARGLNFGCSWVTATFIVLVSVR